MDNEINETFEAIFSDFNDKFHARFSSGCDFNVDFGDVSIVQNKEIFYNTTAYWNAHPTLITKKGAIYIYGDWKKDDEDRNIAGMKIGDGTSYLIDMPFKEELFVNHVDDVIIHITEQEREFWNNKVRCFIDPEENTHLVFTTK